MVLSGLKIFLNLMKASQKVIMKKKMKDIFSVQYTQYPEKLHDPHNDLPIIPEIMKIEKSKSLIQNEN